MWAERSSAAERMRRYRDRRKQGRMVVPVEVGPEDLNLLTTKGLLRDDEIQNPEAIAAVADDLRADLDQLLPQRGQRPVPHCLRQGQRAHEVAEIVGQGVKLKPNFVCGSYGLGDLYLAVAEADRLDRVAEDAQQLELPFAEVQRFDDLWRRAVEKHDFHKIGKLSQAIRKQHRSRADYVRALTAKLEELGAETPGDGERQAR